MSIDQFTHPDYWRSIVDSALEEDQVDSALLIHQGHFNKTTIPSPKHVQLLLYLHLHPDPVKPKARLTEPIDILHRILAESGSRALNGSIPDTSRSRDGKNGNHDGEGISHPRWMEWNASGKVGRKVKKVMTMCLGRGVWELLWNREDGAGGGDVENGENSRNSVGEQDEEEKEEEEDRSEAERVLSVRGWELLDWLVQLWEDDQATSTSGLGEAPYSRMLLFQLPQSRSSSVTGGTLPQDNASVPMSIIQNAYSDSTHVDADFRRRIASRLLVLLINTCLPRDAPFHPNSFILSLLQLTRNLPYESFKLFLSDIQSNNLPQTVGLHICAISLEDLYGVREERTRLRRLEKSKSTRLNSKSNRDCGADPQSESRSSSKLLSRRLVMEESGDRPDFMRGHEPFPPPSVAYLCAGLLMMENTGGAGQSNNLSIRDRDIKQTWLKLSLFNGFIKIFPPPLPFQNRPTVTRGSVDEKWMSCFVNNDKKGDDEWTRSDVANEDEDTMGSKRCSSLKELMSRQVREGSGLEEEDRRMRDMLLHLFEKVATGLRGG